MSEQVMQLLDFVQEELEGADDYAKLARHFRASDSSLSRMYAEIAEQELLHVELLKNKASDLYSNEPHEHGIDRQLWLWECDRVEHWADRIREKIENK